MQGENLGSAIKATVRRRIVMHSGGQNLVIYEGKLAKEFGVSRTPIRQVIQSLAAESLVEVRSGVGTIAAPLLPERRIKDAEAFAAILKASAECPASGSVQSISIELAFLRMHLDQSDDTTPNELFFDVANKFISCLIELVEDKIIVDAIVAAYWRFIRRRVEEHRSDFSSAAMDLKALIKDAEYGIKHGDAARTLRMVGSGVEDMIKVSKTL